MSHNNANISDSSAILSERLLTAEQGVLGSMLIDENTVGPMLMAVGEEDFQQPEYRSIFRAFRDLYGQVRTPDPILVNEYLGGAYGKILADLMEITPTSANAGAYAQSLRETSRLWRLRQLGDQIAQAEDKDACRELVDKANMLLCERSGVRRVDMKQGLKEFFIRHGSGKKPEFIRFGLYKLDRMLHVSGGDMVVIGGSASSGKTALALQIGYYIAKKRRVGFFSYETGTEKLMDRTVTCQTSVSYQKLMENELEQKDLEQVYGQREDMLAHQFEHIESSGWTVSSIGSYAMAMHYDVIIVDYLQKVNVSRGGRYLGDFERTTMVSNDLQQLGRRTGKLVIALSQLNRHEGAPTLNNLRQSGQIEQDADVVLLLYKEFQNDRDSRRCLDIAKNKDGLAGEGMLLDFAGDNQRFK